MTFFRPRFPLLMAIAALHAFNASADESYSAQRAHIASEKAAAEQRFAEKQRDCAQRFVVTSCMNEAQRERRDALGPLRKEELRIDTLERKQRAADRLEEIEAKQRADAAKDAARGAASAPEAAEKTVHAPSRPASAIAAPSPRKSIGAAERQKREAVSQDRFERNQADAQKRREALDARNAKRAASGKVAKPLPLPSGASAP